MTSLCHPATQPPRCPVCRLDLDPRAQPSFHWGDEGLGEHATAHGDDVGSDDGPSHSETSS
eukprot:12688778-Prorocentrum_lima.AAC.1